MNSEVVAKATATIPGVEAVRRKFISRFRHLSQMAFGLLANIRSCTCCARVISFTSLRR
ncbi:hypothetical protein MPL3365_200148 [Mesorhizobium plurifarium]|uniref:Uncharacterized protein n=1 Tax=Mesorhizobium plurifarium TaxID=69974 RepID=A0A090G9T8_MESPL|nr:hypothetical protein MPL3365_200148 [Mesorhizobium plurifarium]